MSDTQPGFFSFQVWHWYPFCLLCFAGLSDTPSLDLTFMCSLPWVPLVHPCVSSRTWGCIFPSGLSGGHREKLMCSPHLTVFSSSPSSTPHLCICQTSLGICLCTFLTAPTIVVWYHTARLVNASELGVAGLGLMLLPLSIFTQM